MDLKRLFSSPQALWLFALVCPRVWTLFVVRPLYGCERAAFEVFYGAEALVACGVAVACLLAARRRPPAPDRAAAPGFWILGVLFGLPTILLAAPVLARAPWAVWPAAALGGAAMAWCYLRCARVYSRLEEREAVLVVLVSFSLGAVLRFPLELLPPAIAGVLVCPLPLACLAMCSRASAYLDALAAGGAQPGDDAPAEAPGPTLKSLAPYAVLVVVYGLALGAFQLAFQMEGGDLGAIAAGMLVKAVLPLALLAFFLSASRQLDLGLVCQIGMVLIFTALMLTFAFYEGDHALIAGMASDCARNIFNFILVAALMVLACRLRPRALAVFGLGWALLPLTELGGMLVADAVGPAIYGHETIMYVFYGLVLVTVVVLAVGARSGRDTRLFSPRPEDSQTYGKYAAREDAIRRYGEARGLTARENEIMALICKGRSKRYIAEHLFISENTVKTHTRRLYEKLGVHGRQELLDRIDAEDVD